ncbi:plasma membrane fusion protein prm1 [Steccherinum ochraceum]|uniref:Plasma membrane fusion protein PRM1 n=1 Tax=Steccherinum ochraceum TaxID=92696 RepID=A0A4R0R6S0_9APHY|nr:plasma membrane fusion protein prm1 [Steccherinum ochraceum]
MSTQSHRTSVHDTTRSSSPVQFTTLTPYLNLNHILSLTWLAYPIISLLFVIFRLQLSGATASDAAANAKDDLLTSCLAAEHAATSAASMPRYLAVATNDQIADAVNGTMNAARATLVLALTIMEAIINFIVDIYRSTFLCFLELVVRGALSILIGAVQEFNSFLTSTFDSVRTGIQNDIGKANSAIQSAVDAINKINPFGDISVPQFDIPSLSGLQNVTLPSDFETALTNLNSSLPTLDQLKDKVESIIDTPFELVKKDINDTFAGINFDRSTLPVPAVNTVTFCDDMDTSVVDDLAKDLVRITKIGTVILVAITILLLAANCTFEWYKWRSLHRRMQNTRDTWTADPGVRYTGPKDKPLVDLSDHNLLMIHADTQHPFLSRLALRLKDLCELSPSQYIHLEWFFRYIFHPPALACFLIGFFGLLSVQIQLWAVNPLAAHYQQQAAASANDFSNLIASQVNASMYNQSSAYAADVNGRVDTIQSTINDGLFGWVNGTTTTLNNTINDFYTELTDAVNSVFNGTILQSPVDEFIRCFIGSKVDAIENALTFLHDNLHVNIPRVNETVLVLSPTNVNEVTQPIAAAAVGGQNGDSEPNQGLVGRLVGAYVKSLEKERLVFGIFMALWGVVVLMGLAVVFWHSYGRDWWQARERRKWQKNKERNLDGFVIPYRYGNAGQSNHADQGFGSREVDEKAPEAYTSFSPMSSPKGGFLNLRSPSFRAPSTLHPLNGRNPDFEKSWDSFLDGAAAPTSTEPEKKRVKISRPMKLVALGRGKVGTEKFVGDQVPHDEDEAEAKPSWFQRVAALWRKKPEDDDWADRSDQGLTSEKPRPNLTIAVSRASSDLPPGLEGPADANAPVSAWSVSPGPPPSKLSWMPNLRPKSRRTASVPDDVKSIRDSYQLPMASISDLRFAVPIHHAFPTPEAPPPFPRTIDEIPPKPPLFLEPPPVHPRRREASPKPTLHFPNPDTSAPVTKHLTTNHARRSSQAVDPFVTPFDDNEPDPFSDTHAAVIHEQRRSTATNPFITTAI